MDGKTRARAAELIRSKGADPSITYADIALQTGYSERHLKRMARDLREGRDPSRPHGNSGRRPANAATDAEVAFLRGLKEPYPDVTIAHFRDIYLEDVLGNPAMAGEVARLGLVERSASWFRSLFEREGWSSPAQRPPLRPGRHDPHPVRAPAPVRGMLAQVDATEGDWLRGGEAWAMHLAVDDATTSVLGGWFMPEECTRGYARMMMRVVERHGAPASIYADKAAVFRSVKAGGPTQFALMMADLGVHVIFANSPQAKGRVERYNRTVQLRLATDAARFGVGGYDELNGWFNDFYAPYLNSKFSFEPRLPGSAFAPSPGPEALSRVFRARERRRATGGLISLRGTAYALVDGDGAVADPGPGAWVGVYTDMGTGEVYAEFGGARYALAPVGERRRHGPMAAGDAKALQSLLDEMGRRRGPGAG